MFGRNLIDPEVAAWQFDHFALLIDHLEKEPGLENRTLFLPTPEFFPSSKKDYGTQAQHIFGLIREQFGFNVRDTFELEGHEGRPATSLGGVAMVQSAGEMACGTYQRIPGIFNQAREIIRYDTGLEDKPTQLVATFAHELSHALHHRSRDISFQHRSSDLLDVDSNLYELFTDLTAIYMGYGIFLANTRFEFSQFANGDTQGWQAQGAGYLPEADMVFATALFMRIKNLPMEAALPHLKPRLRKMLKKAWRQLDKNMDEIEALRARVPLGVQDASFS